MRLNALTPLHEYCTDKVTAPFYISSRVGSDQVPKRFLVTTDIERVKASSVPSNSCIIKTSHDSGGVFPVPNTATADWGELRGKIQARLARNFHRKARESHYRRLKRAIVIEELLQPKPGSRLSDLKVFCFHGRVRFMVIIIDGILNKESERSYFTREWNPLEVNRQSHAFRIGSAPRPNNLEKIIVQAEALAEPFAFVRVDFLLVDDRSYIGELTFSPSAGYERFSPESFELKAGSMLDLSRPAPDWRPYLVAAREIENASH